MGGRAGLERLGLRDAVAVRGVLHAWAPGATTSCSLETMGRTYPGWAHHTVLTAAAFTFLRLERLRSAGAPRLTLPAARAWMREVVAPQYFAGNRLLFNLALGFQRNPPLRR